MIGKSKAIVLCFVFAAILTGATGCEQEGPMEKSGKAVDKAVEDAGDAIKDTKEKMEDAVDEAKK